MKSKLLVLLSLVIVGTSAYVWSSHRADQRLAVKGRKIHLDSLRVIQASLLSAGAPKAADSLSDEDLPKPLSDIWHVRDVGLMPDSVEPQTFSEAAVTIDYDEESDMSLTQYMNVGEEWIIDSAATRTVTIEHAFVDSTVMKVLLYHLIQHVDAEMFSRCPSGYFFVLLDTVDNGWKNGTVYYGEGCDDASICDFRINYPKRMVEIRDADKGSYLSLRTYEVLKFTPTITEAVLRDE